MKNLKNIKEAFLNGKHGINRKGQRVIYIGYELEKVNDSYPHAILIVPDSIKDAEIEWVTENLRYHNDTNSEYDIVGLWEDKPEPFNLERALAGEMIVENNVHYWLVAQSRANKDKYIIQDLEGSVTICRLDELYNKFAMYKEPRPVKPSVDDLPKPIRELNDITKIWRITVDCDENRLVPHRTIKGSGWTLGERERAANGCYYASEEDCQKICDWLMNR